MLTKVDERKYNQFLEENNGDEQKAYDDLIRWKCLTDVYFLGTEILGLGKNKKKIAPGFHRWLCSMLSVDDDIMVLVPRGHAKTTWVKVKIVQLILINPEIRILLVSKASSLMKLELASIKRMLATPLLRYFFGHIIPDPGNDFRGWAKSTESELILKHSEEAVHVRQEPTLMAVGAGSVKTGLHPDVIFMDDFINEDTVRTAEQMKKSEEQWGYLQPLLDEGGQLIITGTFYHYNDLYNKIISEGQISRKNVHVRKAIENGKVIYPGEFSLKRLAKLKARLGPYMYSCQYDLNPLPKEDIIFPGPQPTVPVLPDGRYRWYLLIDPAPTTEGYSDETGAVVAAVDEKANVWIVEANGFKKKPDQLAEYIIMKNVQYPGIRTGIEFGLQVGLKYILEVKQSQYQNQTKKKLNLDIQPIKIQRIGKAQKIYRSLGAHMRAGKVKILESCREIILELDTYTGKGNEKDNIIDAASMLFEVMDPALYHTTHHERVSKDSFYDIFKKKISNVWRDNFNLGGRSA